MICAFSLVEEAAAVLFIYLSEQTGLDQITSALVFIPAVITNSGLEYIFIISAPAAF